MCCYKEYKNFERFNNIVQAMLNVAIGFIQTLPQDCQQQRDGPSDRKDDGTPPADQPKDKSDDDAKPTDDAVSESVTSVDSDGVADSDAKLGAETEKEKSGSVAEEESWSLEEKDRLFQFVTKVFLMNFPMYMAYKHSVNTSLEELSQQEAAALNNYCELSVSLPVSYPSSVYELSHSSFDMGRPFCFMDSGVASEQLHSLQPKCHRLHIPKQIL